MSSRATNNAVLYLRSSKDRSDVSIDAQRRELTALASQRGLVVVGEFTDVVESGSDANRPGLTKLAAAMRQRPRPWTSVLLLDTSRLARKPIIAVLFERDAERNGVRVIYKSIPDDDPITGQLIKSVFRALDEYHSLISKAKGLAGMAENVRQGFRAGGRAPRGYRLVSVRTGAVRDGSEVLKSKLEPDAYAPLARNMPVAKVESIVVETVATDLASSAWAAEALKATQAMFAVSHADEIAAAKAQIAALEARASRMVDVAAGLESPAPVLRRIDEIERERVAVEQRIVTWELEDEGSRSFANVTEAQVRRCLRGMADDMRTYPRGEMRDFLTSILSAVELDPAESTVRLSYRIPLSGNSVASPGAALARASIVFQGRNSLTPQLPPYRNTGSLEGDSRMRKPCVRFYSCHRQRRACIRSAGPGKRVPQLSADVPAPQRPAGATRARG